MNTEEFWRGRRGGGMHEPVFNHPPPFLKLKPCTRVSILSNATHVKCPSQPLRSHKPHLMMKYFDICSTLLYICIIVPLLHLPNKTGKKGAIPVIKKGAIPVIIPLKQLVYAPCIFSGWSPAEWNLWSWIPSNGSLPNNICIGPSKWYIIERESEK